MSPQTGAANHAESALDAGRARDAETGLYNESFMREMLSRLFKLHDRGGEPGVSVFVFAAAAHDDIGLRAQFAQTLSRGTRGSDIPVHLGAGVMAVFLVGARPDMLQSIAERICMLLRQPRPDAPAVTVAPALNGGIAMRRQRETLESLLVRARAAMDQAVVAGRNKILAAVEYFPV